VDREAQTADEPEPDDLRRIEGIGPKISAVLLEAGVSTYKQLSVMGIEQIRELLDAGGIRVARPDTWPEQAQLAADADWQALEKLQGELKGGRRA
jgi:large subunit ribosomal protein L21